jgi:hypothetical protein
MNADPVNTTSLLKMWLDRGMHRMRRAVFSSAVVVGAAAAVCSPAMRALAPAGGDAKPR